MQDLHDPRVRCRRRVHLRQPGGPAGRPGHGPGRRSGQRGVTLAIVLVILLMMMLVATGVVRLSTRHTQVVNNEQVRTEAVAAAHYALDMVINEPAKTWDDLKTAAGRVQYVNLGTTTATDSAQASVPVTVHNMTCKRGRVIKNTELVRQSAGTSYVPAEDASCFGGGSSTGLTIVDDKAAGSSSGDSNCASVLYDVAAEVADPALLNATARMVQGVEVRTDITTLSTSCD